MYYHHHCHHYHFNHPTFDPDISGSYNGKNKEEEDEEECLKIIGRHSLHTKQNGTQ